MGLVNIAADLHVHLYPCYDIKRAFDSAFAALATATPAIPSIRALALTERHDCHYFEQLKAGRYRLAEVQYEFEAAAEPGALEVLSRNGEKLYLFAGRQIISKEKIEVLALTLENAIPDGLPVVELLQAIRDAGGIPVINWAPGKWFFKRGKIVEQLIDSCKSSELLLGDTSLRPEVWKEPRLMSKGKAKHLKIIKGSDPLPFAGEEELIGSHGVAFKARFNLEQPLTSFRAALLDPKIELVPFGKQIELMPTLQRLKRNEIQRRIKRPASGPTSSESQSFKQVLS